MKKFRNHLMKCLTGFLLVIIGLFFVIIIGWSFVTIATLGEPVGFADARPDLLEFLKYILLDIVIRFLIIYPLWYIFKRLKKRPFYTNSKEFSIYGTIYIVLLLLLIGIILYFLYHASQNNINFYN